MMTDDMQEKINKLLEVDLREYFIVNNAKFECHFLKNRAEDKPFSEWKKDSNSPSFFREARLRVYDNSNQKNMLEGMILVQRNDAAANPLSAVLYVKPVKAKSWTSMYNVTSIII